MQCSLLKQWLCFPCFVLTLLQVEKGTYFLVARKCLFKNIIPKTTLIIMFRTVTIPRKHLLGFSTNTPSNYFAFVISSNPQSNPASYLSALTLTLKVEKLKPRETNWPLQDPTSKCSGPSNPGCLYSFSFVNCDMSLGSYLCCDGIKGQTFHHDEK